jgi:precorrin-8X/cobalt-precorrin-8 methylmutase
MVTLQKIKPEQIEKESFRIIEQEFFTHTGMRVDGYEPEKFKIIRRVIHATGDFSFASTLTFHERAIKAGLASIRKGKNILIDVNMGASGISRGILKTFGGEVICRVGEQEVGRIAKTKGLTRSEVAFDLACDNDIGIVAVGNAPTALLAAMRLLEEGRFTPDLVVGVPVGFVNAEESKELLCRKNYPFIAALGRKGGSPVAVAIINALLRLAQETDLPE